MKTQKIIILVVLFAVLLSACNIAPTPEPVFVEDEAEKAVILADSDVFIQNVIDGIKDKDFATFSKDFDEAMLKATTTASFNQLAAIYSALGAPTSVELKNVQDIGTYFAVRYIVKYPEKTLTYRLVVDKNDPRKVSGLWFE